MTVTHRQSRTPEHNTWCEIRRRCYDPSRNNYYTHGGRGIRVCERWHTFENFYADMGPRPSDGHSIERINNDGNYEPGNCCWATKLEQSLNTRRNRMITAFGKTAPLGAFINHQKDKHHYQRTWKRIMRGWDHEAALLAAPGERRA